MPSEPGGADREGPDCEGPDYEGEVRRAWQRNIDDIEAHLREGRLDKKIDSFCRAFGFAREEVVAEIRRSRVVAAKFALDPKKQNIYEGTAAAYIGGRHGRGGLDGVENFRQLPSASGLSVFEGKIRSTAELRGQRTRPLAKSIDFSWRFKGCDFFASHKYTKEEGGAQDSAYRDLRIFIEQSLPSRAPRLFFVAIADGRYYRGMNGTAGVTRLENLRRLARGGPVVACSIDRLLEEMERAVASAAPAELPRRPGPRAG